MSSFSIDSLERLSLTELVGLVRGLIGEVERLREENEKLNAALASTKRENQQLKDEIRRLKGLPPRPPIKPSGMEKATDRLAAEKPSEADAPPPRRRGPGVSKLSIDGTVTLTAPAPAGSRHKGYEEIIVQDIAFKGDAHKLSLHVLIARRNAVIPFWMERVAGYVEARHFRVGDLDALCIGVAIEPAGNLQTGFRRGVGDQCDDDEEAGQRHGAPVLRDVAEHAMLDLVPLRCPRRIMADHDDQTGFVGELLERQLPQPQA